MTQWKRRKLLVVGLIAVLLLWASAILVTYLISRQLDSNQIAHLGATGDIFGASSALFGGLGSLGVVIVLLVDLRERREDLTDRKQARRPFVVPEIADQGATLSEAKWVGQHLQIGVTVVFEVTNVTEEPALNLRTESQLEADGAQVKATVDIPNYPIGANQTRKMSAFYSATGASAQKVLRSLSTGGDVFVPVEIAYSSLSAVEWVSKVKFRLNARQADLSTIASLLDPCSGVSLSQDEAYVAAAEDTLLLSIESVADSWVQGPRDLSN